VTISEGETFGLIDIVFREIENEATGPKKATGLAALKRMKQKFTCHTQKNSIIHELGMEDLIRMELEYKEVYDELFDNQQTLLVLTLEQKQIA